MIIRPHIVIAALARQHSCGGSKQGSQKQYSRKAQHAVRKAGLQFKARLEGPFTAAASNSVVLNAERVGRRRTRLGCFCAQAQRAARSAVMQGTPLGIWRGKALGVQASNEMLVKQLSNNVKKRRKGCIHGLHG